SRPDRGLEVGRGGEVSPVRHHVKLGIPAIAGGGEVALRRRALGFRTAGDEEHCYPQVPRRTEKVQGRLDWWVAPQLIPGRPAARSAPPRIAGPRDRAAEIVELDDLPIGKRGLVNV